MPLVDISLRFNLTEMLHFLTVHIVTVTLQGNEKNLCNHSHYFFTSFTIKVLYLVKSSFAGFQRSLKKKKQQHYQIQEMQYVEHIRNWCRTGV